MTNFVNFLNAIGLAFVPLLLGALGEILTEKSGHLNLGVEGLMYMGGIGSIVAAFYCEQALAGSGIANQPLIIAVCSLLAAMLVGGLGGLIYSVMTVTFHANQNVTGLTLTIFGTGIGNFFGEYVGFLTSGGFLSIGENAKKAFASILPAVSGGETLELHTVGGVFERLFLDYNWMVFFSLILAVVMIWFFNRTFLGLRLKAVGENPAAADAAGINVALYRYLATIIGSGITGIAGMYIVMVNSSGVWSQNCIGGRGWLAIAVVLLSTWSPVRAIWGAMIFGGLSIMRLYYPIQGVPMQIYDLMPYIATIIVLLMTSIRQLKEHMQPKGCGLNYFREDR